MRAPVSIIIPTLNAGEDLPAALSALAEGLDAGLIRELIVSDGGSDDDTVEFSEAAGAILVKGARGRGGQLARGAALAQGNWLLFLHADTQLGPGWAREVLCHICDHNDQAGYFKLAFRSKGFSARFVAGWANWRSRWLGLPYGDQGMLVPRDFYTEIGGYPAIALMEDVALARALKGKLRLLEATAYTSAARYEAQGWWRRGIRNHVTLLRYLAGVDPEKLARSYNRR